MFTHALSVALRVIACVAYVLFTDSFGDFVYRNLVLKSSF